MFFKKKKINMQQAKIKLLQEKIFSLVVKILESGAEICHAPESDQYFLVDKKNSISIGVTQSRVRVANHVYTYTETLPLEFLEKTKKVIRKTMEARALALKKELFRNEVDLLDKISKLYDEV